MAHPETKALGQKLPQGANGSVIHLSDGRLIVVMRGEAGRGQGKVTIIAPEDIAITRVEHHCGDKESSLQDTVEAVKAWNDGAFADSNYRGWAQLWEEMFDD